MLGVSVKGVPKRMVNFENPKKWVLDILNVIHIAPNAGHTAQNDGHTMQNDVKTMHNVGRNTLNVCQEPRAPHIPILENL